MLDIKPNINELNEEEMMNGGHEADDSSKLAGVASFK